MDREFHAGGMVASMVIVIAATIGAQLTTLRGVLHWDAVWIATFSFAILLFSAAAANFDLKRWLW